MRGREVEFVVVKPKAKPQNAVNELRRAQDRSDITANFLEAASKCLGLAAIKKKVAAVICSVASDHLGETRNWLRFRLHDPIRSLDEIRTDIGHFAPGISVVYVFGAWLTYSQPKIVQETPALFAALFAHLNGAYANSSSQLARKTSGQSTGTWVP